MFDHVLDVADALSIAGPAPAVDIEVQAARRVLLLLLLLLLVMPAEVAGAPAVDVHEGGVLVAPVQSCPHPAAAVQVIALGPCRTHRQTDITHRGSGCPMTSPDRRARTASGAGNDDATLAVVAIQKYAGLNETKVQVFND